MNSNMETIQKYLSMQRVNGIKESTLHNDKMILPRLAEFLGSTPFEEASKDDLMRFIETLLTRMKASTLHTYKVRIKKFYNRLFNLQRGQYPQSVAWIRTTNPYKGTKTKGMAITFDPEDLLTPKDILTLVNSCENARDQALIMVAYETSAEANELVAMKIKHMSFDQHGGRITLESGEGRRTIRLVDSIPYLTIYLNIHPLRKDPEAPLWVTRQQGIRGMGYDNLIRVFRHIRKKSGIKKPVTPRYVRHAGLTRMAKLLPEQMLKKYAGWVQGSKMAQIYVHLTSKDLDHALLEAHGIAVEEKAETAPSVLKPLSCARCGFENPVSHLFCGRCGMILKKTAPLTVEDKIARKVLALEKMKSLCLEEGLTKDAEDLEKRIKALLE